MTERILEAFSKRDPASGADYLGTCTLVVGDGTMKVDFVNGRAQVPESLMELVLKHPQVVIPGYSTQDDGEPVSELEAAQRRLAELEELAAARARIAELEAAEVEAARTAPKPQEEPAVEFADSEHPPGDQSEVDPKVQAAIDHLREEGEEVPDVIVTGKTDTFGQPLAEGVAGSAAPVSPNPTFDTHTPDGNARCQATKADGSQCANGAVNGQACQLGKHQEQLAA